jgi:hypothetical protein
VNGSLVFRCSCGGQVVVPHGSPGGAEQIVAAVRRAHLDVGHHEVDILEFRRIRARQQVGNL